jgi:hypothetical protein
MTVNQLSSHIKAVNFGSMLFYRVGANQVVGGTEQVMGSIDLMMVLAQSGE